MLVYGMTEKEMANEVISDMVNAFRFEDVNQNKFRREVLKASRFPIYRHFEYTSPRKNKWLVFYEARTKKEFGDNCRITFVVTHNTPHGVYATLVSWVEGKPQLIMYPPHFFSRFRERMQLNATGIELMKLFFRHNASYVYEVKQVQVTQDTYINEIYGSCKEGVALGVLTVENNILFKTFITYDMLKGEQVNKFIENEKLRKEIHEN